METTRRELIQLLAAVGVSGASVSRLEAQLSENFSAEQLKAAVAIHGGQLPADRIEIIGRALRQTLDEFEKIRSIDIDDAIAPPVVFKPADGRV